MQVATRSVPNDKKDRIDELSDDMVNDFVATQPIVNINGHAYDLVDTTPCEYYEGVKHYKPVLRSAINGHLLPCLLYTSPSPRDRQKSRMPSSA